MNSKKAERKIGIDTKASALCRWKEGLEETQVIAYAGEEMVMERYIHYCSWM